MYMYLHLKGHSLMSLVERKLGGGKLTSWRTWLHRHYLHHHLVHAIYISDLHYQDPHKH